MSAPYKPKPRSIRIPLELVRSCEMYDGYLNIEIKESPKKRKKKKPMKGDQA